MKITTKTLSEESYINNDYRNEYVIEINERRVISANDYGEPEDNILSRDLNFVYKIVPLLELAYEAGKNGEELEITHEELEEL